MLDRVKKRIQVALTTIRTSSKDEKIGKVTCEASLEITVANAGELAGDQSFKSLQSAMTDPADIDTTSPLGKLTSSTAARIRMTPRIFSSR